eukprot:SAG31_NODE_9771_length_1229_cov_2.496460_1_plen_286_part_10
MSFLILNLMVGVICDAYAVVAEEDENFQPPPEQEGLSYAEQRSRAHEEATGDANIVQRWCQKLVASQKFENFIMLVVLLNTLMWASVHDEASDQWLDWLEAADFVFLMIYCGEMIIKLIDVMSIQLFFSYGSNVFDFSITLASVITISIQMNVTMLRALRLSRALKVLNMSKSLRKIVQTVVASLPGTLNVMVCSLFFMIVYAVMGVQLFHDSPEFERSSFVNFGTGMLTMFQCVTGEDWVDIMYAGMVTHPVIAPILFITFTILINFILLNVVIGIICVNFELQD